MHTLRQMWENETMMRPLENSNTFIRGRIFNFYWNECIFIVEGTYLWWEILFFRINRFIRREMNNRLTMDIDFYYFSIHFFGNDMKGGFTRNLLKIKALKIQHFLKETGSNSWKSDNHAIWLTTDLLCI